jgi:hypothetical protein
MRPIYLAARKHFLKLDYVVIRIPRVDRLYLVIAHGLRFRDELDTGGLQDPK